MPIINENYPESELTGRIIGRLHGGAPISGKWVQEVIYQRALAIEFNYQLIQFSREHEMSIFYKGQDIGIINVSTFLLKAKSCLN